MNLPIYNSLLLDSSTYITFSKAHLDFDYAVANNTPYYFSKCVALKLPLYENPSFFIDLNSINITETNPNTVIPKAMQFYMENIINNSGNFDNCVELAFYKLLNKCGITYDDIFNNMVYINKIMTSNFVRTENNNGWGEVVAVIPNDAKKVKFEKKLIEDFPTILQSSVPNNSDDCLYDNGSKQYLFERDEQRKVIDFDTIQYLDNTNDDFEFNVLLFFYRDNKNIDKLHGINFISPFINKITNFELPTYRKQYNNSRSIGYQFKLNMKTVNNEASRILIEEHNDGFWTTHFDVLSRLSTFLDSKNVKFMD